MKKNSNKNIIKKSEIIDIKDSEIKISKKLISFIIPCYNSSKYMKKCIESILELGDDIEILIIDDGSSKDNTLEIAKSYEIIYPNICRAIHKKNGGHGDALNVGIKNATGLYTKVVDSDDWINVKEGKKLLSIIRSNVENKKNVDLYITNYVYDKVGQTKKKVMSYKIFIPQNKIITWDNIRFFTPASYMMMHALTYRTEVLRKSNLVLPKNTFYVDNLYAYKPLVHVHTLYYLNVNLYHYFIGRDDQSVNEKVMISRLSQQYKVTRMMLYDVNINKVRYEKLKQYMINYLSLMMTATCVYSIISYDDNWLKEEKRLWDEIKKKDKNLYKKLRYSFLGMGVTLPGETGKQIAIGGYKLSRLIYGFN